MKRLLCTCSENRVRPELSIPSAGQKDRGLRQGSRALALSNTGSRRFTDFLSNLANLIGWEYETIALHMLRKSGPARALDPFRRSEGSWLWGRECGCTAWVIWLCACVRSWPDRGLVSECRFIVICMTVPIYISLIMESWLLRNVGFDRSLLQFYVCLCFSVYYHVIGSPSPL